MNELTPPCSVCGWESTRQRVHNLHEYAEAGGDILIDPRDVAKMRNGGLLLPVTHCELCGEKLEAVR
jgi:hypothetical protein